MGTITVNLYTGLYRLYTGGVKLHKVEKKIEKIENSFEVHYMPTWFIRRSTIQLIHNSQFKCFNVFCMTEFNRIR